MPHVHRVLTVGTPEGITSCTLLIPLPIGETGDDLHRAFDDLLHLGQGRVNDLLDPGKCLGGLYAIIPALLLDSRVVECEDGVY